MLLYKINVVGVGIYGNSYLEILDTAISQEVVTFRVAVCVLFPWDNKGIKILWAPSCEQTSGQSLALVKWPVN